MVMNYEGRVIRNIVHDSYSFPTIFPIRLQIKTAIYSLRIHCGGKLMADREGFEASYY